MTNIKTPPAHPGEHLEYKLFRRGMTQSDAARKLGIRSPVLNRCIREIHPLSTTLAIRLERAGVGKAVQWLAWQTEYDLYRASFMCFSDVHPFPLVYTGTGKDSE